MNSYSKTKGWSWVPSLYFAEGLPYAFVMIVSVVLYKKLNISILCTQTHTDTHTHTHTHAHIE